MHFTVTSMINCVVSCVDGNLFQSALSEIRVQGFGSRVSGLGFQVPGPGFRVSGFGSMEEGLAAFSD